ncbi:amino acid transporter [Streptomyces rimosus subsp. pseudoverticillatus]|uniref:peptide MFS transporter n=1 Tax=Streptomyces rimosus TaxID=1927 RepID=UPI0006B290EE|nr:oligopeptide:H+ symporter [Streptomyces rimosus]KOT79808.1 amino acid transporter [Streptomyces rimosus subsp. pseudoverticillatus]
MASSLTKDAAAQGNPASDGKTFFGHPRGLATLFMTEMWERFSFYGMRALLVLYLISGGPDAKDGSQGGGLGIPQGSALSIYAVYMAMVYLLAMPGGWFGDRVWGPRKTVIVGASVVIAGHVVLAIPGQTFFVGLAMVALGSGLLKSNISTMVGHLYNGPSDKRRDGGFTVFYMSINIGSTAAPLVIGGIGQSVNWHLGFGIAAVGMALGLIQFLFGTKHLDPKSSQVPTPLSTEERNGWLRKGLFWAGLAVVFYAVIGFSGNFNEKWLLVPLGIIGILVPFVVLLRIKRDKDLSADEQSKVSSYVWFFVAAAAFWMIFDQAGSTLNVFAEKNTADTIFGLSFPSSWLQSVNPIWVLALAPVFASVWVALANRSKEPKTTAKFTMGMVMIGASYFIFLLPITLSSDGTKVTPLWLIGIYCMQTIGELCISPVGLSVTTKLAPAKYASQMMGVWFLANTAGDSVVNLLGQAGADLSGKGVLIGEAVLATLAGVIIFLNRKRINGQMNDVN